MNLNIVKNQAVIHNPAVKGDAGYDIVAISQPRVIGSVYQGLYYTAISHLEYDTELRISPEMNNEGEYDFFNLVYPRSSIMKTNLVLANSVGVIDSGYSGNIKLCFKYISQPEDLKVVSGKSFRGKDSSGIVTSINPQRVYHQGDKIAQLIPCKHNSLNINYVNNLNQTERGSGGFGSTGK
jgi:dUTPase